MRLFFAIFLLFPFVFTSCRTVYIEREVVIVQQPPPVAPQPKAPKLPNKPANKPTTPPCKPVVKEKLPAVVKKHIVLDAGHGGKDKGTCSEKLGYQEKERALATTKIVKSYLEDLGYKVSLTRASDVFIPLPERAEIANTKQANLFVSIHYNHCENKEVDGIEIFYYKDEKNPFAQRILDSKKLGEEVLGRMLKHTGAHSRGVKKANFAVIRETKMPAILIECGFLSNEQERERIKEESYLCYLGWGIARGIDSYLKGK